MFYRLKDDSNVSCERQRNSIIIISNTNKAFKANKEHFKFHQSLAF